MNLRLAWSLRSEFRSLHDARLNGPLNQHGLPIVDIRVEGFPDPISVLVDTGFNGELIISEEQAQGSGILYLPGHAYPAMVANAQRPGFYPGAGYVSWFLERRGVNIHVLPGQTPQEPWTPMIGTRLLADCHLEIDFPNRTVVITR